MAFGDLLKETFSESLMEKIIPIVDMWQLATLKQLQMKAKYMLVNPELENEKNHLESELIFLIQEGEQSKN